MFHVFAFQLFVFVYLFALRNACRRKWPPRRNARKFQNNSRQIWCWRFGESPSIMQALYKNYRTQLHHFFINFYESFISSFHQYPAPHTVLSLISGGPGGFYPTIIYLFLKTRVEIIAYKCETPLSIYIGVNVLLANNYYGVIC